MKRHFTSDQTRPSKNKSPILKIFDPPLVGGNSNGELLEQITNIFENKYFKGI